MSLDLLMPPVATPQPSLDPPGSPLFLLLLFFNSSSRRFWALLYSPAVTAPTLSSQPGFPFQYKTQLKPAELTRLIVLHIVFLLTPRLVIQVSVSSHVFTAATLGSLSQIGVWSRDESSSGCVRMIILLKKSQNRPSVFGLLDFKNRWRLDSRLLCGQR